MATRNLINLQDEELGLIKNKFGDDLEDLRDLNDDAWKPMDIRILLTPLRDSYGNRKMFVRTKLHIICPEEYPMEVPKIYLEDTKGLSESLTNGLLKKLQQQAIDLRGEVMILELVQTVQAFLINNNRPPCFNIPTLSRSLSRLKTEFEELECLGKGAFGDVVKVKNILDKRKYAIKRIPIVAKSLELYKKMIREVSLMSRLNHENVVRYYHSWIEDATEADINETDESFSDDWSTSRESTEPITPDGTQKSLSGIAKGFVTTTDDLDFDDGIEFVDSKGEIAVYEEESSVDKTTSTQPLVCIMYIQMEFCGNLTLRTVIDRDKLRPSLLWRLFREILEGLCHIHNLSIIHRDIKPGNIFLDSSMRIKIGDFGQATTAVLALRAQTSSELRTGSGEVGTLLYVAPELEGNASTSIYDEKVDMYPLGIILFEMIYPPFNTEMERISTIRSLRHPNIRIPDNMTKDPNKQNAVKIIRLLMNHVAAQRPSAGQLLSSKLVPPIQLEVQELDKVLRHTFASPQSKAHKHLVTRCLQQKSDDALQYTYHPGLCVPLNPAIDFVKTKVVNVFRRHGAIEMNVPLLSPISKNSKVGPKDVKLMTHSGEVVVLPSDLRAPFIRQITMGGVSMIRRYSVDRVFKEKKEEHSHPEHSYKCSFDIITPKTENHLIDAEVLSVAFEIIKEIPRMRERNICVRINHTSLLRSILMYCSLPKTMHADLFYSMRVFFERRFMPAQFSTILNFIKLNSKISASTLISLVLSKFTVNGLSNIADESVMQCLLREKGIVGRMANRAIEEINDTVKLANNLGVTCPIYICPGLSIGKYPASCNGIVWQMIADFSPSLISTPLAEGERYDLMLATFQKHAQRFMEDIPKPSISGAGLIFFLDRLVAAVDSECTEAYRAIDVCVWAIKCMSELKDVTNILRDLWSAGIRSGIVEASEKDEAQELAEKLGAGHLILAMGGDLLLVRSWKDKYLQAQYVYRSELVKCIQELLSKDNKLSIPAIKM